MLKHTCLLGRIGLLGLTLLEARVPSQTLVGSERDLWERALAYQEDLHAVANDNERGAKETGLDTVEKDRGGKSELFNLKDTVIL